MTGREYIAAYLCRLSSARKLQKTDTLVLQVSVCWVDREDDPGSSGLCEAVSHAV